MMDVHKVLSQVEAFGNYSPNEMVIKNLQTCEIVNLVLQTKYSTD